MYTVSETLSGISDKDMFGEVTCFHEAGYYEWLKELLGELLQTVQRAGRLLRLLGGHQGGLLQRDEGRHRTRVPGTSLVSVSVT